MKIDVVSYEDPAKPDSSNHLVWQLDLPVLPRIGEEIEWPNGPHLTVFRVIHLVEVPDENTARVQVCVE